MSFSRVAGMGLRFLSTGILARLITRDDFGLFAMTAVISGFLGIFMDVGLSQATIQRPEINHRQISTLFWINVALGGVAGSTLRDVFPSRYPARTNAVAGQQVLAAK